MTAAATELVESVDGEIVTADELYKVVGDNSGVDVEDLLVKALDDDLSALNKLWQIVYTKAAGGDSDAGTLALRLLQWRNDLAERRSMLPAPTQRTKETPVQVVRRAATTLGYGSVHAANALIQIARYGRSESARTAASKAILDRVGLAGAQRLEVSYLQEAQDADDAAAPPNQLAILKERLQRMNEARNSM